jgi:hypothetical protein
MQKYREMQKDRFVSSFCVPTYVPTYLFMKWKYVPMQKAEIDLSVNPHWLQN